MSLHQAVRDNQLQLTEQLLTHKADVNARDHNAYTPLHYATNPSMVKLLLQAGAHPDVQAGHMQKTPLHYAASNNCAVSAKLLLEAHARVDCRDKCGYTALMLNVDTNTTADVVNVLLAYGANITAQTSVGCGVMHFAAKQRVFSVVQNLVLQKADVFQKDMHGQFPVKYVQIEPECKVYLENVMWEQRMLMFCQGLHPRLGSHSSVRRAFTSDLSERYLIWLIGLFLKPSS